MKEWTTYKLKDICIKITDGSHFSPTAREDGYPMFSVKDMEEYGFNYASCKRISLEDFNTLKANDCVPQKGDILVAKDGSFLKQIFVCNETKEEAILSSIAIFRPNPEYILPEFLCYILKSPKVYNYISQNCVSGSALPRIVLKAFKEVEVSIPSIAIQKWIISKLIPIDHKIQLNRQINDNLEQQAQALYKSWFVDFEPFKDQEFVESEFGLIPEGWHCTTISELLSIKYGKDHKKLAEGIVPVYGSGGLMRYVDTKLHEGEAVLIPRKGSLNNVMYVNEAFWTVDTMFYSIPKQEYSCIYAYLFLANKDLASMNAGSAVPSMTTDILNSMHIIAPPVEVLKRFNNICDVYFSRINQNNIENANLSKQRDTLLPKLMSGELKINEIDC